MCPILCFVDKKNNGFPPANWKIAACDGYGHTTHGTRRFRPSERPQIMSTSAKGAGHLTLVAKLSGVPAKILQDSMEDMLKHQIYYKGWSYLTLLSQDLAYFDHVMSRIDQWLCGSSISISIYKHSESGFPVTLPSRPTSGTFCTCPNKRLNCKETAGFQLPLSLCPSNMIKSMANPGRNLWHGMRFDLQGSKSMVAVAGEIRLPLIIQCAYATF